MSVNTQVTITIDAKDQASAALKSIGSQFKGLGDQIDNLGSRFVNLVDKSKVASAAFAGVLGVVAKNVISVASEMEQARVSFDVMLGSADKGAKLLAEISEFAKKTPFDLPQVVEGSKRLLAYNIEAEKIIPTMEMLGNIAAGVGKDKLPNLILAFGQMKAATKLTGMELRQFTEAGVPLLTALTEAANKAGGQLVTMGGSSSKAKVDVDGLNKKLAVAKQRLTEASGSAKTKQSTLMSLKNTIGDYESKLSKANDTQGTFTTRVKVTEAQMREMISDGAVTFDQAQAALAAMTSEGGRFFNLMGKLSETFGGRLANIRDQLVRLALNIAGISTEASNFGSVVKGGAFDLLSQGAQKVLDAFNAMEPKVKPFLQWFVQNGAAVGTSLGIIAGGLLGVAVATWSVLGPFLTLITVGALIGALAGVIASKWGTISTFFTNIWNTIVTTFDTAKNSLEEKINAINKFYKDHKTAIDGVVTAITIFFLPALIKVGTEAVIAGVKLAGEFIVHIVKLGIESAIAGGIMAVQLIANIILLGVEAVKTVTTGLVGLILSTIQWGIEGWKTIAMLLVKIIQLGILTAATILQTTVTIGLTAATWLLNAALAILTSPITLIIIALGLLVVAGIAVIKHWNELKAKAIEVWEAIKKKVDEVVTWIKNLLDNFRPTIKIGLDLPDVGAAWNNLKQKAHDIGVPGFATGGVVPGPIGSPVPIMAHAGEKITPAPIASGGGNSGGSGGINLTVQVGLYAGTEIEKRNIARELYSSLLQVAKSQNKDVREFMGG